MQTSPKRHRLLWFSIGALLAIVAFRLVLNPLVRGYAQRRFARIEDCQARFDDVAVNLLKRTYSLYGVEIREPPYDSPDDPLFYARRVDVRLLPQGLTVVHAKVHLPRQGLTPERVDELLQALSPVGISQVDVEDGQVQIAAPRKPVIWQSNAPSSVAVASIRSALGGDL